MWYYNVSVSSYYSTLYLDFYLPTLGLAIEYDGIQHFKELPFFGDTLEERKLRDKRKGKILENLGIKLIRISYKEKISMELVMGILLEGK